MAWAYRRRRARRRLAAIAFLSDIPLDLDDSDRGSHTNTNQEQDISCDPVEEEELRPKVIDGLEAGPSREQNDDIASRLSTNDHSISSAVSQKTTKTKSKNLGSHLLSPPLKTQVEDSSRKSSQIETTDQKQDQLNADAHEGTPENLGDIAKTKPDCSRTRISRDTKVRNRRILLASNKRAPIIILSSLIRLYDNGSSAANNGCYNKNEPADDGKGDSRIDPSSSSRRRHKSSMKRQSSKNSKIGDRGRGGHEGSRQNIDTTDLFAIMNMDKPGPQDASYGSIFARPARPQLDASNYQSSYLMGGAMGSSRSNLNKSITSPASSPPPISQPPNSHNGSGQFFDFEHIYQPIYGSSNVTTRPMSHHLAVFGAYTSGHCGCFRSRKSPNKIHDLRQHMQQSHGDNIAQISTLTHHSPIDLTQQPYHAHLLDDPDLVTGKHATVLACQSYISSVIEPVKPADVKRELNERFRARYPNLQLTLSKLRSIKREMYQIGRVELQSDHLVVAQAYVYFEKLCLKHLITKQNRKLCAGASLLLSAKLNDIKGPDLKSMIEHIETSFRLKRRDLIAMEFGVTVALDFALHIPLYELFAHYERLIIEG